jgi:hypothetical protein
LANFRNAIVSSSFFTWQPWHMARYVAASQSQKIQTFFYLMITLITAIQVFVAVYVGYTHAEQFYFKMPF